MKELENEKREIEGIWNTRKDQNSMEKSYEEEVKKLKNELEKLEKETKESKQRENDDRLWELGLNLQENEKSVRIRTAIRQEKLKNEMLHKRLKGDAVKSEFQWYQDGFKKIGDIFKTDGIETEEKYKKMMEKLIVIQDKYRTKVVLMASSSQGVPEPSSSNQAEKSVHMGHDMAQKRQMIAKKKYHKLRKNIRLFKKKMVHKMNRIRVNQKKEVRRLKAEVEKVNEAKREVEEAWDEGKAKMDGDGYFDNFGGKNEPPLVNLMKAMRRAQDLNIKLRKRGEKIVEELQYFKDRFRTIMDIVESKRINKEEKYNQMVKKFIEIQEKQDGVPSTLGPQPAKKKKTINQVFKLVSIPSRSFVFLRFSFFLPSDLETLFVPDLSL
ncbi:hypothetical protein L5515_015466 [Caenorhabditis briggsae]|uniref:Uncharacterized protein n=1 Tax=Caenorhabditis briggsae TaxID=6238 RepID=A0AAE9EHE2_CAEBR|nr:hypothetical protein L5515_015466 [Caenorhabditis briggsae]